MKDLWQIDEIESALQADIFDIDDWQGACKMIPTLERDNQRAGEEFCGQPIQDGFLSLFKVAPELTEKPGKLAPLADLIKRGMDTPEWKGLRESTVGERVASAFGAQHFVKNVLANLPQEVKDKAKKASQKQEQADDLQNQAENLQSLIDMLQEMAGQGEQAIDSQLADAETQAESLQQQLEKAQSQAEKAQANYEQVAQDKAPQIQDILNQAAKQAEEQAEEANSFAKDFSLAAGGDPSHIDPEIARAAMELLAKNKRLQKLADLIGWAKEMVRGEWRNTPKKLTRMTGYKRHELKPERMAGVEMAAMVSPVMRTDFFRRVAENDISHRTYEGNEKQGKGPMILVRDESGSMSGEEHSTAIALEWALLSIARRQNRDFYSIPFSSPGQYHIWKAPAKGKADPQEMLFHLGHFYGNGTEPYQPMMEALNLIEDQDLKADIMVLTDGYFGQPSDEFLQMVKDQKNTKIITVMIGGRDDVASQFSHKVINVSDLYTDREQLRGAVRELLI